MILRFLPTLCRAFTVGALGLAMASCSSTNPPGPGGQIVKVKYFHLLSHEKVIPGIDPPVKFERDYYMYGAISNKERLARDGYYYEVMWKVTDRSQPVKVRFEYRQQNTGMTKKVIEKEVTKVDRDNTTSFEVNGAEYVTGGGVTSWRATLVRGKEVLGEAKSYLWD
ncbi:MAG: hypothetical protein K8R87_11095 [Verrucomicrobia bacterium]|nr:hypothetical protein [Verrucomicrobiota bacterium]